MELPADVGGNSAEPWVRSPGQVRSGGLWEAPVFKKRSSTRREWVSGAKGFKKEDVSRSKQKEGCEGA